jgi:hypothetical protein
MTENFDIEGIFDFEGAKELFQKHRFDYAVCTATDFDFDIDTMKFTIAWDQLSFDDVYMRNCNGKDCIDRSYEQDTLKGKSTHKYKACYYGVTMRNVLEDNNIKY